MDSAEQVEQHRGLSTVPIPGKRTSVVGAALWAGFVLVAILVGVAISWPFILTHIAEVLALLLAVSASAILTVPVSSTDRYYTASGVAALLGFHLCGMNLVPLLSVWALGVLIGRSVRTGNVYVAAKHTAFVVVSAAAMAGVWAAFSVVWRCGVWYRDLPVRDLIVMLVAAYVSLAAYYVTRFALDLGYTMWTERGTRHTAAVRRLSFARIALAFATEYVLFVAGLVATGWVSTNLDAIDKTAGATVVAGLLSLLVFGMVNVFEKDALSRQMRRLNDAILQMQWEAGSTATITTVDRAVRLAMPMRRVRVGDPPAWKQDFIISQPFTKDQEELYICVGRKVWQRPFVNTDVIVIHLLSHQAGESLRIGNEVARLNRSATTDALTGLANYRAFQEVLTRIGSELDPYHMVGLIYIDVDNFKFINDTYGHENGNTVLREVARRINKAIETPEVAARMGGDEFAVVLPDLVSHDDGEAKVAQLASSVSAPVNVHGAAIPVKISLGISFSSPGQKDLTTLVERADQEMYATRREHFTRKESLPNTTIGALEKAITEDRLDVVYQPIVDMISNQVVGLEALVRYTDPAMGVMPAPLIAHEAARMGLLSQLSRSVLERVRRDFPRFQREAPALARVHVNIPVSMLHDRQFCRQYQSLTAEIPGAQLVLELVEDSFEDIPEELARRARQVSCEEGVLLALDDFGAEYSNLLVLMDYDFSVLKVSKRLTDRVGTPAAEEIITSVVSLSNRMGMQAVFEGVETSTQASELVDLGVKFAQGFLYGRPLSAEELLLRLEATGLEAQLHA